MQRNRPPSAQAIKVMRALAADPSRWRYGYDLVTEVGLKSGSLYPILVRLADRGLLDATWEPGPDGRPPRHLYRLSAAGREYVAALPAAAPPAARANRDASWLHACRTSAASMSWVSLRMTICSWYCFIGTLTPRPRAST